MLGRKKRSSPIKWTKIDWVSENEY